MTDQNNNNESFEELCAGYVLHALDEKEREEFEELLHNASKEQTELFHQMYSVANQLAFTVERDEPSEKVRQELMKKVRVKSKDSSAGVTPINDQDKETDTSGNQFFAIAASIALFIITLSLVFYSFNLSSQLNNKEEIINQKEAQISELKSEVQRKDELLSILESRTVEMVLMAGLDVNPEGYGKIIWDADKQQALLQVSNLPAVPSDKDYQLWIIKNNQPVSAGVFAVNDPQKDSFFKIEQMAKSSKEDTNAFAVTIEPKGGVPQPTGDMYLLGNLNE
ncbi:MAG: anti-sigma factor [Balneolaceae bacterium]|nr:anti-sigma factor [Balneolaceae bacterium]